MKRLLNNQWIQPAFVIIPLIFSIINYYTGSVIAVIAAVISLFLLVALLPVCRLRQNLWMFVFSAVALIPSNIRYSSLLLQVVNEYVFSLETSVVRITGVLILFHALFCFEQILLNYLTRRMWRRQYKSEVL